MTVVMFYSAVFKDAKTGELFIETSGTFQVNNYNPATIFQAVVESVEKQALEGEPNLAEHDYSINITALNVLGEVGEE